MSAKACVEIDVVGAVDLDAEGVYRGVLECGTEGCSSRDGEGAREQR